MTTEAFGKAELTFKGPGFKIGLRPVDRGAPDNCVCIMYRRNGSVLNQSGVGSFREGVWRDGKGKELDTDGLYWTTLEWPR